MLHAAKVVICPVLGKVAFCAARPLAGSDPSIPFGAFVLKTLFHIYGIYGRIDL